jgi:TonB family protein
MKRINACALALLLLCINLGASGMELGPDTPPPVPPPPSLLPPAPSAMPNGPASTGPAAPSAAAPPAAAAAPLPAPSAAAAAEQNVTSVLNTWDQKYSRLRADADEVAAMANQPYGPDGRERSMVDDVRDWVLTDESQGRIQALRREAEIAMRSGNAAAGQKDLDQANTIIETEHKRMIALISYWGAKPVVDLHRKLWEKSVEAAPADAAADSRKRIDTLEQALYKTVKPEMTRETVNGALVTLIKAFNEQRSSLAVRVSQARNAAGTDLVWHQSVTPCPAIAERTSGTDTPKPVVDSMQPDRYFPPTARRAFIEGRVVVRMQLTPTGCVEREAVAISSGAEDLDNAALAMVEHGQFLPAEREGKAIGGTYSLPVRFALADEYDRAFGVH